MIKVKYLLKLEMIVKLLLSIKSIIQSLLNNKSSKPLLMTLLIMLSWVFFFHLYVLGINGTIFCYGQTASGKTHTIVGDYSS